MGKRIEKVNPQRKHGAIGFSIGFDEAQSTQTEFLAPECSESSCRQTHCCRGHRWDCDTYRDCSDRFAGASVYSHSHWPFHTCDGIPVGQTLVTKGPRVGYSFEIETDARRLTMRCGKPWVYALPFDVSVSAIRWSGHGSCAPGTGHPRASRRRPTTGQGCASCGAAPWGSRARLRVTLCCASGLDAGETMR